MRFTKLGNKSRFKKYNIRSGDTSGFVKITDLANLKSIVDKLDIDKLKNVPANLSNLKS